MGYIIFATILALLMVGAFTVGSSVKRSAKEEDRKTAPAFRLLGCVFIGVFLIVTAIESVAQVGTKKVVIETWFGAPHGSMGNGLHLVAPWSKTTEMDAAIQTDDYIGDGKGDGVEGAATTVGIYGGATARIDNSTRWRLAEGQADELFEDYNDFANIRRSLVLQHLNVILNDVYSGFNPMALAGADAELTAAGKPATAKITEEKRLAAEVQAKLKAKLAGKIDVEEISIPRVIVDDATQKAINDFSAEVGRTKNAAQRVLTAKQEAEANNILASSLSTPGVAQMLCLQMTDRIIAATPKDKPSQLPPGWSCLSGGPTPVLPIK